MGEKTSDRDGDYSRQQDLGFYSRRIRLLRRLLPLLALALLLILGFAANPDLRRAFTADTPDNDRLVIAAPTFLGRLADGRPYQMTAFEGRQKADGNVILQKADIRIDADNPEGRINLSANLADYQALKALAALSGNVAMRDAQDNILTGTQMLADLDKGILTASAVTMRGAAGIVTAHHMKAVTETRHYRFTKAMMRLQEPVK